MFINKTIFTISLTLLLKSTPLFAYSNPREWVNVLDNTLESALKLRPKVKDFINKFTPNPYDGGRGSRFYVGAALMKAIQQNKLHGPARHYQKGNERRLYHLVVHFLH